MAGTRETREMEKICLPILNVILSDDNWQPSALNLHDQIYVAINW